MDSNSYKVFNLNKYSYTLSIHRTLHVADIMNPFLKKFCDSWPLDLQSRLKGEKDWNPESILEFFINVQISWMIQFGRSITPIEMDRQINGFVKSLTKANQQKALRYAQGILNNDAPMVLTDNDMVVFKDTGEYNWNKSYGNYSVTFQGYCEELEEEYHYERYLYHTKKKIVDRLVANSGGDARVVTLAKMMQAKQRYIPMTEANLNFGDYYMHSTDQDWQDDTYDERVDEDEIEDYYNNENNFIPRAPFQSPMDKWKRAVVNNTIYGHKNKSPWLQRLEAEQRRRAIEKSLPRNAPVSREPDQYDPENDNPFLFFVD